MERKIYIATYSAHATILEKLSNGMNAKIEKLYVSYGGFKAPRGSYDRSKYTKLFAGRQSSKNVLHAKVILNDFGKRSSLWIWTGNLRKSTNSSQNILFSIPINEKNKRDVRRWFSKLPEEHLVINIENDSVDSVETASKLFKVLENNINALEENGLQAYVFSPWGSSEFLKKLSKFKPIEKINVYTRNTLNNCWIDYKDEMKKIKNRFIAQELIPFPHSKALFLTNKRGRIVWAYIGSANFTKAAMFKTNNVECAAIFKNSDACNLITDVLKKLKNKHLWDKHECGRSRERDESKISYEDDWGGSTSDSTKGFEKRQLIRDAEIYFSKEDVQKEMEKKHALYKGEPLLLGNFKCRITSIDDYYHLLVSRKKKEDWVEIDVDRKVSGEPPENVLETSAKVTGLFNLVTSGLAKNRKSVDSDDSEEFEPGDPEHNIDKKKTFINIRFPIEKIMKNAKLKKAICEQATEIKKTNIKNLPESDRILLSNWLPLIERLKQGV